MSVQTNEAIRSLRRRISGELEELRPATVGRNGRTETEGTDRFGHQHFLKAQWDHLLHGAEDMNAGKGEEGDFSSHLSGKNSKALLRANIPVSPARRDIYTE